MNKLQYYRSYSRGISLDSLEPVVKEEDHEEIHMTTKIGFGSGHVYNDIAAKAGTGYAMLFFTTVIGLSNAHAGFIFLIGNIVDAIAVTTTGFLIDVDFKCMIYDRYGKLKSWHFLGTICLLIGFILLFLPPLGIEMEEKITAYYAVIFVLANLGYALDAILQSPKNMKYLVYQHF